MHDRANPDDIAESDAGYVIGLGPSGSAGKFVRVRSYDGYYRIWSKDRIINADREG